MVAVVADRVRDVSATTGSGALALFGTHNTLYRLFSDVCTVGDTLPYVIQHREADEWEVGIGTYSAANELTRTRVISSSTGAAVDFSAGEKDVILGSGAHTEAHRFNVAASSEDTPTVTSRGYALDGVTFADKYNDVIRLHDVAGGVRASITTTSVDVTVPVTLPGNPTAPLQAVPKQYVDDQVTSPSNASPAMDSVAAAGIATTYARGDHVHPSDTSKASAVHSHTSTDVTDFSEAVDDRVSTLLVGGANVTVTYNDLANTLTVSADTGTAGEIPFSPTGGISATDVQAAIAELDAEKVAKAGDTMTGHLALPTGPLSTHAVRKDYVDAADALKADVVHTHTASQITDFSEATDDRVSALLQAGTNVTLTYNDTANTLTINSSGGGGGGTGNTTLYASDIAPLGAAANDLWWHTSTGSMYIYYNDGTSSQWVETGSGSSSGGSSVHMGDSPPSFPVNGRMWWHTSSGVTYIYYNDGSSSQWVEMGGAA